MEVKFNIKNAKEEEREGKNKCKRYYNVENEYEPQVAKLSMSPLTIDTIEDLPWHIIMGIYENLNHKDLIPFMTTSRTVRDVVWDNEVFWRRHFERCFGRYIPRKFRGQWRAAFLATANSGLCWVYPNARVYIHTPSLEPQQGNYLESSPFQAEISDPPHQGQDAGGWFHRVRRLERRMASFFGGAEGGGGGGHGGRRGVDEVTTILVGVLGPGGSGKTEILRVNNHAFHIAHSFLHSKYRRGED